MRILTVAASIVLLMAIPLASAHGAPDPTEESTRLLADWNDDCGGDGGAATGSCKGSQDLIALDVQEAHDQSLGDVIIFRLYADAGRTFPLTDTLTFSANGNPKTLSVSTSDGSSYAKSGFDRLDGPTSLHDGGRFTIDLVAKASTLGVQKGDRITGFKVEAKAGSNVGDFMPGGCHNTVGDCVDTGQSADQYIAGGGAGSYTLRGTDYYVSLTGPSGEQAVQSASETIVQLSLSNRFRQESQTVTITATDADGVKVGFHSGEAGSDAVGNYKQTIEVALPASGSTTLHLRLEGQSVASGIIHVKATTDRGGTASLDVPYRVQEGHVDVTTTPPATSTKSSPGPGLVIVGLAILAIVRRRA